MSKKLRELQSKKSALVTSMRAITDKASAEKRDVTDEEQKTFDAHKAELDKLSVAITNEQALIEAESGVDIPANATITVDENIASDPKLGFNSFGEFAAKVRAAGAKANPQLDARFAAVPALFMGEGVGQDGGFLVPPEFAREIFTLSQTEESLLPLTDNVELGESSNSMVFPKDETTPWGTDGVRAYWGNEAGAATGTKGKLGTAQLRLNKLIALVPITDELLGDASALGSYLPSKMADSIRWKHNEAFMFGTGNGQPLGAFSSPAVEIIAKESGQATATLLPMNLAKMIARLPTGASYGRAVWMINNDVLPALFTMTLGNYPIYMPPTEGLKGSPFGALLGRPIMITQHAKSFSSEGDVLLADWKYYRTITKAGGIQVATSMHLYFDADAAAFRSTFRVDGQSKIAASIPPANGSAKLTPFVKLGAR
jgi:HK97 family phage major capsid protein